MNTLMLTHVLHALPTAMHHAWVCSSGSKGYHALKEMLQNGIPGHTLLIESGDLRDLDLPEISEDHCCLVYVPLIEDDTLIVPDCYQQQISVTHITVYSNDAMETTRRLLLDSIR